MVQDSEVVELVNRYLNLLGTCHCDRCSYTELCLECEERAEIETEAEEEGIDLQLFL